MEQALLRLVNDLFTQGPAQFVQQCSLLLGQRAGRQDMDHDQLITPPVAPQIRHAPAPHADHVAGLGAGRDHQFLFTIHGGDLDLVPQSGLGHVDVQFQQDVAILPLEEGMAFDVQHNV